MGATDPALRAGLRARDQPLCRASGAGATVTGAAFGRPPPRVASLACAGARISALEPGTCGAGRGRRTRSAGEAAHRQGRDTRRRARRPPLGVAPCGRRRDDEATTAAVRSHVPPRSSLALGYRPSELGLPRFAAGGLSIQDNADSLWSSNSRGDGRAPRHGQSWAGPAGWRSQECGERRRMSHDRRGGLSSSAVA